MRGPADPNIAQIADALSERLVAWRAADGGRRCFGHLVAAFNGRALVRMELRPQLVGRVDPTRELFAQENGLLVQVERDSRGAFAWDEGHHADPELLGPAGISHYLLDTARTGLVLEAILAHPALDAATRAGALGA